MQLRFFHVFLTFVLVSVLGETVWAKSYAIDKRGRFGFKAGYASASQTAQGEVLTETPGGINANFEYLVTERSLIGVEHLRTITNDDGTISTAIAFTGIYFNYYPTTPASHVLPAEPMNEGIHITSINYSPYIGISTGFAQSSLRDRIGDLQVEGAVGFYVGFKAGIERQIYRSLGANIEFSYAQDLVGGGKLTQTSLLVGLFLYL